MANVPGYNTANARLQDGSWEIQGTVNIDKANGGVLTVDGVDVSACLEELANLNGLSSADVAGLEALLLTCGSATLAAPTAEAADARTVSVQLNDHLGAALAHRAVVQGFISTDANGDSPGDGGSTIVVTAGTDGAVIATDESGFTAVSESDGDLDLVLTDSADAAQTVYLHIVLPTGKLASSAAIAFADDTP